MPGVYFLELAFPGDGKDPGPLLPTRATEALTLKFVPFTLTLTFEIAFATFATALADFF